jgi:O-antigen/teichoic acid export membrane protein
LNKNGIELRIRSFNFSRLKPVVRAALPLGLAVIFNFLYDKIDVLLISKLKGFDQVAYYNIGYGLYKSASIGFSFLLVAGFTQVSSISKDKAEVNKFFKEHLKAIIVICLIIAILLFVFSGFIVKVLYTERYSEAVIVIQILAAGFIGLGLNNLTGITLNGMGFFRVVMYITLYGLIINILLNFFFIPLYGIVAASVISVATEYFIFSTQYYYLRKVLIPDPEQSGEGSH